MKAEAAKMVDDFRFMYDDREIEELFIKKLDDEAFQMIGRAVATQDDRVRAKRYGQHVYTWAGYEKVKGIRNR